MAELASAAIQRLRSGFRPATMNQYTRMFRDFLYFLEKAQISPFQVTTVIILAFMEYLHQKGLSQANISNHMATIMAMFIVYGLNTAPFKDERLPLFIKSLKINAPLSLRVQKIIPKQMLQEIVATSKTMDNPLVFRTVYLFTFFFLFPSLQYSPTFCTKIRPHQTFRRGDIIFSEKFCTVIVKWTKTLQDRKQMATITIPSLGDSPLCPVKALINMFQDLPADKNSPLFCITKKSALVPLTDSVARKHLKQVYSFLSISPTLTFYMFRKSATTWAFDKGVPLQDIIQHGTWSSSAVWRHIHSIPSVSSQVSRTFQQHLYL